MLTPNDFEKIAKQAKKIYSQLELEIIKENKYTEGKKI